MQQTQILYAEDTANYAPITVKKTNASAIDSIIYFDLIADDYALKSAKPKETKRRHESFFAEASRNKTSHITASQKTFLKSARRFPIVKDEPKLLFDILLVYLDRIVCLDVMAENLKKLDAAVEAGNTGEINRIAYDCADICADCEMFSAIAPLLELERVECVNQMERAAALSAPVKKEFERCNLAFEKSLERLAATEKFGGYISV